MTSVSMLFRSTASSSSSSPSSSSSSSSSSWMRADCRTKSTGCRFSSSSKNRGKRVSIESGNTKRRNDACTSTTITTIAMAAAVTAAAAFGASTAGEVENKNKKTRKSNKLPTRMVVETAMLAAMTGLSFHLSASFRLETYLGSLFPLPIVVASARWGDVAAWRTLLVAFLLLTLLSGPLRASNYACLHGFTGLALGMCWKRKFSWVQSVPISALARTIGVFSSLAISSLVIRENVLRLMVQQVYALIDQICATLGATFVPNMTAILCVAFVFVILNSLSYTLILHLVYSIALVTATPDGNFSNAPLKVRRSLGLPSAFMQ